jgi:DNA-directed RNA polymerase delta subunit
MHKYSIAKYQSKGLKKAMKTLHIDEQTYVRLTSILEEVMHSRRRDINYDDIINELIDTYQENKWGHIGSDIGGG